MNKNKIYVIIRNILLPVLFMAFFSNTSAQTGTIKGKVETADGHPAELVNVSLLNTMVGTVTDSKGQYEIHNVKNGLYTLVISYVGLETKELQLEVIAGETTSVSTITLEESAKELEEVIVQGSSDNTYNTNIISDELRIKSPILETPQNIQVITKKIIDDQQLIDMREAVMRNVSGAQMLEHWENYVRINMRGFRAQALRNGMDVTMTWGPLAEDMSIVERVEFIKGPAGFMLSSNSPSGFYNIVTKKPSLNAPKEVTLTIGSFNTLRATADFGGKLTNDGKLLYRVNVMGQMKESHRDYEFNDRFTIAPSIKYKIDENTTLTGEYIYQYSRMSVVGASYVFSVNGFGTLDRDYTTAEPNIDPTDINEHTAFLNLNHKFNDSWQITAQIGYLNYLQYGSSLWPDSVTADGIYRGLGIWDALSEVRSGQAYINGDVTTGSISHKILIGLDAEQKKYYADWFQSGSLGTDPLSYDNPVHSVPTSEIPVFDRSESIRKRSYGSYLAGQSSRLTSLYLQDRLGFFGDKLRLTVAGRYSAYQSSSYGAVSDDDVFTPRVGLSYSIDKNTSVYSLYDVSFLPETGSDYNGDSFEPVKAKDIEAGIKRKWADNKWNSSLTIYRLTEDNVLTTDPEHVYYSVQLGQVRSQGIEFDLQGEILPGLAVVINYAYTDVEVTEDTDETAIGSAVAGHSKHITNGWLSYSFPDNTLSGLGISLGYQYLVDRSTWSWDADNDSMLPDYFRLDGAVTYNLESISIRLNVNNILDEYLYSGGPYSNYYYWQTEPGRNFRLETRYRF